MLDTAPEATGGRLVLLVDSHKCGSGSGFDCVVEDAALALHPSLAIMKTTFHSTTDLTQGSTGDRNALVRCSDELRFVAYLCIRCRSTTTFFISPEGSSVCDLDR